MPFANAPHMIIHQLTGTSCTVLSTKNRHLGAILSGTSAQRSERELSNSGERKKRKSALPPNVPIGLR